jgi:hypothetical protein
MTEDTDWKHSNIKKFEAKVEASEQVSLDSTLPSAPMGITIEDLLETAKENEEACLITSTRNSVPMPLGACLKVKSLHGFADVVEVLGTNSIEEIEKDESGALKIGFYFD